MENSKCWHDRKGNLIQAHGGSILFYNGRYYWYGENKDTQTVNGRVKFVGFSVYSSDDLLTWENEGFALKAGDDIVNGDLQTDSICERPKVIYNRKTKQFVLWFHYDDNQYMLAKAGIAISKSPIGPFKYIKSFRPNERESRDMTLFQDFDDSAYLVNSIDGNSNMSISRLNDDYTELSGETKLIFIGQYREAPAMFVHENKYYVITSGCSGWNPNSMLFGISDSVMGNWKLVENPCVGANYRKTFGGQSACIFKFGKHIMLLMDHWKTEDLRMSGYSILHVNIEQDTITIPWDENLIIESPPHPSEISL